MGGWLSKEKEEEHRETQIEYLKKQNELERQSEILRNQYNLQFLEKMRMQYEERKKQMEDERRMEELGRKMRLLSLSENLNFVKVTKNLRLVNDLLQAFQLDIIGHMPDSAYTEETLLEYSDEYQTTKNIFRRSNKPIFHITKINRVDNIFLLLHYELMKAKFGTIEQHLTEKIVFHGTKEEYLDNICSFNFDRCKVLNHKFGWGVSFARDSYYATHYGNVRSSEKVMILTKTFFGEVEIGNDCTIVPPEPCYTTTNPEGTVFVKYDDASFYPAYVVYYEGVHPRK